MPHHWDFGTFTAKDDEKIDGAHHMTFFVTLKHVLNVVIVLDDSDIQILKTYVHSCELHDISRSLCCKLQKYQGSSEADK
jgi:hypothetical protein